MGSYHHEHGVSSDEFIRYPFGSPKGVDLKVGTAKSNTLGHDNPVVSVSLASLLFRMPLVGSAFPED